MYKKTPCFPSLVFIQRKTDKEKAVYRKGIQMRTWKAMAAVCLAWLLMLCLISCGEKPAVTPGEGAQSEPANLQGTEVPPSPVPTFQMEAAADETIEPAPAGMMEGGSTMDAALGLRIGQGQVSVEWEENESTAALLARALEEPIEVPLSMYGGFEQVGSLGESLPRADAQITTRPGDIVLYSGNQIVLFYGSNSWAYTRLGRITGQSEAELTDLLGQGDVTITIFAEES